MGKDTKKFINKLINKFMFTANYLYLICFTTIYLRQKIRIMLMPEFFYSIEIETVWKLRNINCLSD